MLLSRLLVIIPLLCTCAYTQQQKETDGKAKKKKDLTDYTDADLERLYDEWEVIMSGDILRT